VKTSEKKYQRQNKEFVGLENRSQNDGRKPNSSKRCKAAPTAK